MGKLYLNLILIEELYEMEEMSSIACKLFLYREQRRFESFEDFRSRLDSDINDDTYQFILDNFTV